MEVAASDAVLPDHSGATIGTAGPSEHVASDADNPGRPTNLQQVDIPGHTVPSPIRFILVGVSLDLTDIAHFT